ncbi:MAG TPA: DMT family transporter [Nitrososphaera sp.]|nr:DMT family transporter [Nitrososphaera sp.]
MTTKTATSKERQGLFGYLSVFFAAALFGSVFTVAKIPLSTVDPLALSAIVYIISGLALIPFARASFRLASKKDYLYLLAITGLGAVAAPVLLLYGLQQTNASDASILTNGEVIFTIILSAIFFGEKPKGKIGMFAVGLVIVGLFMATTDMRASGTILQFNPGNLMILSSMFLWAIDNNLSRRLTANVEPAKIAMVKCLLGGIILFAITIGLGRGPALTTIQPDMWLIIIGMSVSGFGGALLLFLQGIKKIGTVKTMSIFSLTPIFGIVIAAIVLGESISIFQGIATAIIIAGILIVSRH